MENEAYENWLQVLLRRAWWTYLVVGGLVIGFAIGTLNMQLEAVSNNAAYFNPKTKEFTWGKLNLVSLDAKTEAKRAACKADKTLAANDPDCILMGM